MTEKEPIAKLNVPEWQVVINHLQQGKHIEVNEILTKLVTQINEQIKEEPKNG